MTYNNLNQLQNKTLSSISNVSYSYDKTGNIKTITDNIETLKSQSFIYDLLYRLSNATGDYGNIGYTYDPIGNRLKEDIAPQPVDESVSYQYNHNNQITKAIKNGITVGEYFYDGTGKRIKKIANGETTIFHYDIFGNIISETDANGGLKSDYVYLKASRVAMVNVSGNTEQNYFYLNNHLETPVKMTDASGAVVWQSDYYPFGEIYQQTGSVNQPFRFPGQFFDNETGLYYNYYRYYRPDNGRYLTADPIGLYGGVNLYAYVQNNPVNKIDPDGQFPIPIFPPPPPPATIPTIKPPWIPPTIPNLHPEDPGEGFKICMALCQGVLKSKLSCPKIVSALPCTAICIANALGGGPGGGASAK